MNANKVSEEIKFINDFKINENIIIDYSHKEIIFSIRNFCEEFLKYCFNEFVKFFIAEIIKISEIFEKYDFYNFINIINFFVSFERVRLHEIISNEKIKDEREAKLFNLKTNIKNENKNKYNQMFNIKYIQESLTPGVMDFIYK